MIAQLLTNDWPQVRAKWIFERAERPATPDDGIITAFRDGTVTLRANRRTEGFTNAVEEIGYHGIRSGDLVIHSMDGFAGAIGVSDSDGKASPVAHNYTASKEIDARYYAYLLRSLARTGFIASLAKGIRERSTAFDSEAFRSLQLPLPPPEAQRLIADYLDRETGRIDTLLAAKRRLIGLMNERWSVDLHGALTAISRKWVPLKSVARYKEGPGILAADFRDEGTPLLRIGNLVDDTVRMEGCGYLDPRQVATRWRHLAVRAGELLVSGSATSGVPVVVPAEADGAIPYTGIIRIWPIDESLDRDFLRLFLASDLFADQVDRLKTGIGLQHWGPSHLGRVRIPLPSRTQQDECVERLKTTRAKLIAVRDHTERQIELLGERRYALVTAATTGQLKIPKAAE